MDSAELVKKFRAHINLIQRDIAEAKADVALAKSALEVTTARAERTIKAAQERCPHVEVEYIPDPSGNNDSYHRCLTCGKED